MDFVFKRYQYFIDFDFLNPHFFWLLTLIPVLIFMHFFTDRNKPKIYFPNFLSTIPKSKKNYLFHSLFFIRMFSVILLVLKHLQLVL